MTAKTNTDTLMKRLQKAADLDSYLKENESCLLPPDFCVLLKTYCKQRKLLRTEVIAQAQIDRIYGHQLFNGTRRPSRDKTIQLAIGLSLTVEETQELLCSAGKNPLDPRQKRDAVILYGLQRGLPLLTVQDHLMHYGLPLLGEKSNQK